MSPDYEIANSQDPRVLVGFLAIVGWGAAIVLLAGTGFRIAADVFDITFGDTFSDGAKLVLFLLVLLAPYMPWFGIVVGASGEFALEEPRTSIRIPAAICIAMIPVLLALPTNGSNPLSFFVY